ncbi:FtsK/SpoIIIE domain-containing protein [Paenarthrobacter sp. NPDC092416]|uniref:FtsK/SpoIIIE domain-containing protein n=1 Tax=Paenarthrobacter sp. NPDC092416 TaxID=3364386 RepID=UPI003813088A
MRLECTLVRGPAAFSSAGPEELTITVARGTSGDQLQELLLESRSTGPITIGGRDLSTLTAGDPPLVNGAVLVDGAGPLNAKATEAGPAGPMPLMLLTLSGPGAGAVFPLQRGRYRLGRGVCEISVPDPRMSREHALLEVSGTSITILDAGSANATLVDEQPVIGRKALSTSSVVRCGNSTFMLVGASSNASVPVDAGRSVEEPLEVPRKASATHRATTALAAVLPLVVGVGLAVATGMWMFLAFTAVSAVSLLVPLLTGRRGRKELKAAVSRAAEADGQRRRRHAPSAAELLVSVVGPKHGLTAESAIPAPPREIAPAHSELTPDPQGQGGIWLRIGSMASLANIRLVPEDPEFQPPLIGTVPLSLDPRRSSVTLRGNDEHVDGLLRFILMQLAAYPSAAACKVILLGPVERLPLSARFLTGMTLAADASAAFSALQRLSGRTHGLLMVIDPAASNCTPLVQAARNASWQVISFREPTDDDGVVVTIEPSGSTAVLDTGHQRHQFTPDLVSAEVFDRFCRSLAATSPALETSRMQEIPPRCSLRELLPSGARGIIRRWSNPQLQHGLIALLGAAKGGPLTFDLRLDGPHLLVAGTTGSGKSELLRTLVTSLALSHSPDTITFMFIDFKGGSGLQPLAGLPHCVGFLTDLGSHQLDRALVSLRGEVRRREEIFAASGSADLASYRRSSTPSDEVIPHLALVIDEFRMLVDEAPAALRELMRLAAIGRSLGIHLIMATQRPQGALTADIRANVTSSIALRVQTEMESMDIINSKAAAAIAVDTPGRAYLARASNRPEEFQTASLTSPHPDSPAEARQRTGPLALVTTVEGLTRAPTTRDTSVDVRAMTDAAEWVATATKEACNSLGLLLPRRPVAAPLPASIGWDMVLPDQAMPRVHDASRQTNPGSPGPQNLKALGLLDEPDQQRVTPLVWSPSDHGHLALVGNSRSGSAASFKAAATILATQESAPYLYVLDADGTMGNVPVRDHVGAVAGLNQPRLALRVLELLTEEMARRRTVQGTGRQRTEVALIVSGWCSWIAAFRSGPFGRAEDLMHDIIRDGSSVGLAVLVSGERELVGARFFSSIPNRAFFPAGSSEEAMFHWPRLPAIEALPGRAVATGAFAGGQSAVAQFRSGPAGMTWPSAGPRSSGEPPFRLRPLPDVLGADDFQAIKDSHGSQPAGQPGQPEAACSSDARVAALPHQPTTGDPAPLWIGVGGDDASPVALPLRPHGVTLILGGHGAGKSSLLGTLESLNPHARWVHPQRASERSGFWTRVAEEASVGALRPDSILLVDDAESLDADARAALADLAGKVLGIVMTANASSAPVQRLPLAQEILAAGTGIFLAPKTAFEADMFGVRLEVDPRAPVGRGFLVHNGKVQPFQAAYTAGATRSG